jgi:hypothetical protein
MKVCKWAALAFGATALFVTPGKAQAQVWIGPSAPIMVGPPVMVGPARTVGPAWGVAPGWQPAPVWGVRRYYRPVFRTYYRPYRRAGWYAMRGPRYGAVAVSRRW